MAHHSVNECAILLYETLVAVNFSSISTITQSISNLFEPGTPIVMSLLLRFKDPCRRRQLWMTGHFELDLKSILSRKHLEVSRCSVIVLHRVIITSLVVATNLFTNQLAQNSICTC